VDLADRGAFQIRKTFLTMIEGNWAVRWAKGQNRRESLFSRRGPGLVKDAIQENGPWKRVLKNTAGAFRKGGWSSLKGGRSDSASTITTNSMVGVGLPPHQTPTRPHKGGPLWWGGVGMGLGPRNQAHANPTQPNRAGGA